MLQKDSAPASTDRQLESRRHVGTRTATQVRTHAQKYFLKLAKLQPADGAGHGASSGESWGGSEDDGAAADWAAA